jgi:DNA-binding NarL/FixJ family response regulator
MKMHALIEEKLSVFENAYFYDEDETQPTNTLALKTEVAQRSAMRQLVELIESGDDFADDGAQAILDFVLDGYRYVVTRTKVAQQVHLSPREQEIVRLIAKGLPNKGIAMVLDISQYTVATYLKRLFLKLDVCSRAQMIARVLEMQLD